MQDLLIMCLISGATLPVSTIDSRVQKGKLRKNDLKISNCKAVFWITRKCLYKNIVVANFKKLSGFRIHKKK